MWPTLFLRPHVKNTTLTNKVSTLQCSLPIALCIPLCRINKITTYNFKKTYSLNIKNDNVTFDVLNP